MLLKKASSGVHSPWRIPSWQSPPDVALEHWMNVQFTNNLGANEGKCVPVSTPPYYFELFMKTLMDAKFVFALCQSRVSYIAPWSRGFLKLHFIVVNLPRFPKFILNFYFYCWLFLLIWILIVPIRYYKPPGTSQKSILFQKKSDFSLFK